MPMTMKNLMITQNHPYHLTSLSPWPLIMSVSVMNLFTSILYMFHLNTFINLYVNLSISMFIMFLWWNSLTQESLYIGNHNLLIIYMLKKGMILFIISEIMFFTSFFWTYFHLSLSPSIEIGAAWPPMNIPIFNPYNIPLLNTLILLSSGLTITWTHYSMINSMNLSSKISLLITIILGIYFSFWQFNEYKVSFFSLNDSSFSSIFYMATGFHGIHVIIGTSFNLINLIRMMMNHFSVTHHCGFELSAWYWHFVDVVWLFLYLFIYWWPF